MHGPLHRGLLAGGLVGAGLLFAVACSEGSDAPGTLQSLDQGKPTELRAARPEVASLIGKATVPLSSRGTSLVPVSRSGLPGETSKLDLELPIVASGSVRLHPATEPEASLTLTPTLASSATAELASDGSAVYERAFGSADMVTSATLDGLHTEIAIRDGDSPDFLSWRAELGSGLRPLARDDLGTDIVDTSGKALLSVSPVSIVDGKGNASQAPLYFDADGYARLRIDHRGLAYPALADFSITLGDVQALAITPTQIKGRVMVLLDTSGSMIWHFGDNNSTHGDSTAAAMFCDNALGNGSTFACNANKACTGANGGRAYWTVDDVANPSRMLASKLALQNVVNANAGVLDFGLERFAEDSSCPNTTNPEYCCNSQTNGTTRGRCEGVDYYTDIPNSNTTNDLTYAGGCGTPYQGGRVLVSPGAASGTQLLPWIDFVEDFCSSTNAVGGPPRNPEIRGTGNTPLGRAVITARESWYRPVYTDSHTAGTQPLDDSLIDCRPYVLVVMTDGVDTCSAGSTHGYDCAGSNAACGSNKCFDSNTNNNTDWRCSCSSNAQCTGQDQTCNTGLTTQDCNGDNAQCGSGDCQDTPGNGDNWRCTCATDADCGTGMVCATNNPPDIDCRGDNARCISNNCYDAPGPGTNWRCACTSDAQCPASERCDTGNNRCVARGVCRASGSCQIAEPLPRVQVQRLTDINASNPVKTYVLGMGDPAGLDTGELDAMAVAGGTTQARLANSQSEIEAAFADIVANTVKYEVCNGLDDNCNARIDEGLGVYQECLTGADCNGGTCNAGRCTCNANAQCASGYTCSAETPLHFCRPSCSEGQGACLVAGVRKCGVGVGQCCVNDDSPTCTDIVPPSGSEEVCNGIDDNCNGFVDENLSCQGCVPLPEVCDGKDNDCDGKVDETGPGGLVDVGGPCGSSVGLCKPGTSVCVGGKLGCSGDTGPFTEVCNGYDDDCDGVIDGMTQACYTGKAGTEGVGICHGGVQQCTSAVGSGVEKWGNCAGQQLPQAEICNGLDDDCDGVVDNGIPSPVPGQVTGDACCSDKAAGSKCGQGQCKKGVWACAGNVVVCANAGEPSNETCDNVDNDCDGQVDNIVNLGGPCVTAGACSGTLQCDSSKQQLVCQPNGATSLEVCNGLDDDCDGKVDEIEDVSVNDPWWGQECDAPPAGHDKPPCKPGKYVCKNGQQFCDGAVQPLDHEVCDLKDNDCDGVGDTLAACPGVNACVQGVCVEPCHGGEFPCPGGYDCQAFGDKKYCVPTTCNAVECPPGASCKDGRCTLDAGAGGAGNEGGASTTAEGGAPSSSEGGAPGLNEGGDGNQPGAGADSEGSPGGGKSGAGTSGNGSGAKSSSTAEDQGVYGLVTGGGGCACRTAPSRGGRVATLAGLLLLGALVGRRRRGAGRRAA